MTAVNQKVSRYVRSGSRVALIVGSSRGIGLRFVEQLLDDADYSIVYAACRDPESASDLVALQTADSKLRLLQLDVVEPGRSQNQAVGLQLEESLDGDDLPIYHPTAGVEEGPVTGADRSFLNAFEQLGEEGVAEVADHHPYDLRALPDEPSVVRAGTQATILELEDRIAAIDYQLSDPDAGLTPEETEIFWRERVRLMESLVRLRYAQAQRTGM